VGWVDSDDVISPIALEKTVPILEQSPDIGMVYTDYRIIDGNNQVFGVGDRCSVPYSPERLLVHFLTFHFRLIRRSLYEQVGGVDVSLPCAMDYDLCLKLSEVTQVHHLEQPLYFYRSHGKNISTQQRIEQIQCSQRAILAAIERRGLSDRVDLEMDIQSLFRLVPKSTVMEVRNAHTPPVNLVA
jgi:GT2 family glycosyltransferase